MRPLLTTTLLFFLPLTPTFAMTDMSLPTGIDHLPIASSSISNIPFIPILPTSLHPLPIEILNMLPTTIPAAIYSSQLSSLQIEIPTLSVVVTTNMGIANQTVSSAMKTGPQPTGTDLPVLANGASLEFEVKIASIFLATAMGFILFA